MNEFSVKINEITSNRAISNLQSGEIPGGGNYAKPSLAIRA